MKVDLWLAKLDNLPDEDGRFLSKDEKSRADRFIHQKYKNHFIKRRSILRKLLSSYLGIKPIEIELKYSRLGKPYIAKSNNKIFFNTSHSKDHVLFGFSEEAELGVDIEFLDAEIEAELISTHFFCSAEISLIQNSVGNIKSEVFFRLWCIKEAYIKLIGKGLTFPLDQVLVIDTMSNPKLVVPTESNNQEFIGLTCRYIKSVNNFGIGVVVKGNDLEISFREYDG